MTSDQKLLLAANAQERIRLDNIGDVVRKVAVLKREKPDDGDAIVNTIARLYPAMKIGPHSKRFFKYDWKTLNLFADCCQQPYFRDSVNLNTVSAYIALRDQAVRVDDASLMFSC